MASMDSPQGDAPVAVAARPTSTAARKELYLAEEQELQNLVSSDEFPLHFQAWMDQTVAELDSRFATCDDALQELSNYGAPPEQDKGSYWNTDTLIRHCNLTVGKQSLFHRGRVLDVGEHATWRHMIVFKATLRLLQERMVGQKDFLQSVQAELGRGKDGIIFEPQDLATMARALETKLADETVDHSSTADLDELDVSVEKLAPLVHELEELIDKAMDDGHVALGESESAKQLQLFENQLSLLAQQYPVIDKRHTDSTGHHRRRRWHIFRMASRDISSILEAKLRQQEACRADQARIDEQVANYKLDDRALRKRYRLDCSESRDFLMQNKDKQKAVWNSIHALLQTLRGLQGELKSLAEERQVEVQRRLRVEELETSRRQGYDAFQAVATEHRRLLEETIDNAARAYDFSKTLNSFVLDQSASVTERYDVQQRKLQDRLHRLREKHLDVFTQYALKVGRLIDRKELHLARVTAEIEKENALRELKVDVLDPAAKGHADKIKELQAQARELRYEISLVTANYNKFDERVETEVVRPFDLAGHTYEHPRDLVVRISKIRFNKTVDCREAVNERHLIEHQREQLELRRQAIEEDAHTAVAAVRTPVAPPEAQHRTSHSVRYGKLLDRLSDMSATIPDMRDDDPNRPATVAQPQGRPALPPGSAVGFQVTGYEGAPPSAAQADGIRDGSTVRAKFTYEAQDPDELSFFKNDVFTAVCRAHDAGWYMGIHGERQGLFPGNYVEPINAAAPQLGHM